MTRPTIVKIAMGVVLGLFDQRAMKIGEPPTSKSTTASTATIGRLSIKSGIVI